MRYWLLNLKVNKYAVYIYIFLFRKYEEIYPPEISDFVFITDNTYTKQQVLRMEHLVLKVLNFELSAPTSYTILQLYCSICNASDILMNLSQVCHFNYQHFSSIIEGLWEKNVNNICMEFLLIINSWFLYNSYNCSKQDETKNWRDLRFLVWFPPQIILVVRSFRWFSPSFM